MNTISETVHRNMVQELINQYNSLRESCIYYDKKNTIPSKNKDGSVNLDVNGNVIQLPQKIDLFKAYYNALDKIKIVETQILQDQYTWLRKNKFTKLPAQLRHKQAVPLENLSKENITFILEGLQTKDKYIIERAKEYPSIILQKTVKLKNSRIDTIDATTGKVIATYLTIRQVLDRMDNIIDLLGDITTSDDNYIISATGINNLIKTDNKLLIAINNYKKAIEDHWTSIENSPTKEDNWGELTKRLKEKEAEYLIAKNAKYKVDFSKIPDSNSGIKPKKESWELNYSPKYRWNPKANSYQCPYNTRIPIPKGKVNKLENCYPIEIFGIGYMIQGKPLNQKGIKNKLPKKFKTKLN